MPRSTLTKPAALAAVSLFALASTASATVVCTTNVPLAIPQTTAGVYLNLVTGVSAITPGGSPDWDINPWGSGSASFWFNNAANPSPAGATTTAGVIDVLTAGATISAANTFSTTMATPTEMTNWRTTNTGKYLGVRIYNEATSAINYGWIQVDTVSPTTGLPMTIRGYCFQNDGTGISAGTQPPKAELSHGTRLFADLAAVGGTPDIDLYPIDQQPYSSYEVVVDATSGDIGLGAGPALDRVGADGSTILQSSQSVGVGPSRSLRLVNSTSTAITGQLVRVASTSCGSDCGTDDVYQLRTWETTATIPRFNNSASQITVIVLQNRGAAQITGVMYFWSPSGALVHEEPLSLAARAGVSLNTASISALAGQGGSVTIAHDGAYDALVGKGVAVEPATGFAFDSVLMSRPR